MNTPADTTATATLPVEGHSFARFLAALRHNTRFLAAAAAGHPLDDAVKRIETNPAFMQSRLLTRVITALNTRVGEFRPAEISVFDSETLKLIVALMNAKDAGTFTSGEWDSAVERMHAAQFAWDA
jgi:hypothetical protein